MAKELSGIERVKQLRSGGAGREALVNPTTNLEAASSVLNVAVSGLLENVTNLVGNNADRYDRQENSEAAKQALELKDKKFDKTKIPLADFEFQIPRPLEMAYEVAKISFGDYDPANETAVETYRKGALKTKSDIEAKNKLGKQYSGGGAGEIAGEIIKILPIFKFGTMARTNMAMKSGGSAVDVAKAVSTDAIRNIGSLGASEFLLAKAYGESDKEAGEKAVIAGLTGGLGTPALAAAKVALPAVKAITKPLTPAEKARVKFESGQNLTAEEAGLMAGGGKPKDLNDRKEMRNPKIDKGTELPNQKKVQTPEVKKFDISFDDKRGRNYSSAYLNNYQGKTTDKAAISKLPDGDITGDLDGYINSMKKTFKSHINTIETYGSTDAKFKQKGTMTTAEKKTAEVSFQKDLLNRLSKDKRLSAKQRFELKVKAKKLDEKVKVVKEQLKAVKDELDTKTEISYRGQRLALKRPKTHESESKLQFEAWKKENSGYEKGTFTGWSKDFATKDIATQTKTLVDNVSAKLDKSEFLDTLDNISIQAKTKGKAFDINNITKSDLNEYQSNIHILNDFINRTNDLEMLKTNNISAREFAFRESKRLDAKYKRNSGTDEIFEDVAGLKTAVDNKSKEYSDIGLFREESIDVKAKPKDGEKVIEDDTDYKKLDTIIDIKDKALTAYRNGRINRYKSGDKGGEPVLTQAQMRDVDEFGDILSNSDIINKTTPRVADNLKLETTLANKEAAKSKVKSGQYRKLGINFSQLKPLISFDKTIVDVKNSMGQNGALLTGSKEFGEQVFTKGDSKEFRQLLGEKIGEKLDIKIGKKEVKTPVMITGYGSERMGTLKAVLKENDWLRNEAEAGRFLDIFYEEFENLAPALKKLMTNIKDLHQVRTNPVYEWTSHYGHKVRFDLTEYKEYLVHDTKGFRTAKIKTNNVDKMSRALLPNIFHSVDADIAREMRKRMKIHTTHDAWHVPKGREEEAELIYRDILKELNDADVMSNIFKQLGKDDYVKEGKLPEEFFSRERNLLDSEHTAGKPERPEGLKQKPSKQMTESEVLREFMAQPSSRTHNYYKMVDAMIDEAVQSTDNLGKARTSDDVYERALAYALQGDEYPVSKMVRAPDGSKIDNTKWYNEQQSIFTEFRAKAELNPDLKASVLGDRKYFDTNGDIIGGTIKSKRVFKAEIQKELMSNVKKSEVLGHDVKVKNTSDLKTEISTIGDKIKTKPSEVTDADLNTLETAQNLKETKINFVADKLSIDEMKKMDTDSKIDFKTGVEDSTILKTGTKKDKVIDMARDVSFHISEKYKDTKAYKQYQKILGISKNPQKDAERAGDNLTKYLDEVFKDDNQADYLKHLLETDARSIKEFKNRYEADKYFQDNIDLYHRAKPAIDQLALAIGREEHQVGAFLNNARAIAKEYDIPKHRIEALDKMVSIKAMEQNKSWDFYEKAYDSEKFNILMDISQSQLDRSSAHFSHTNSQNKQVKGFMSEYYDGGKTLSEDGKVIWDAETNFEDGAIGMDLTNNKVGKFQAEAIDESLFSSKDQMIAFALKNNLKITDKGFRKIPTYKIKEELGIKDSLSHRLGMTEASIEKKTAQNNSIVKILTDEGAYDELFSINPKPGFVAVTKEQSEKLPFIARAQVKFVNKDYTDKLLGRQESRLLRKDAKQVEKIVDKLATNLVTQFKQNVVLKNLASYKSAFVVNFATNALIDGNVIRAGRNAKASFGIFQDFAKLSKEYDLAKATGKDLSDIKAKLNDNEIQKYLDLGLSINTLDGVRSESSLLSHIASDLTGNRLDKIGNEVLLNQRGTTGNITKNVFSYIDFQGRYMAIKSLEANGMNSADAVRRANDLFGQMDEMAPVFVQMIDKYGAFVFSKWLLSVAPATAKAAKQNPKKAIALTAGLYMASAESDVMLSNISPIEGVIDMIESGSTGDSFVWNKRLQPFILPNIYMDLAKQVNYQLDETQHWHDRPALIFKNRLKPFTTSEGEEIDYRGLTQKTLDKATGY